MHRPHLSVKLKHLPHKLHSLKTWHLALVFILLLLLLATCLRIDHLRMSRLRSEVLSADAEGNDETLAANLNKLRDFAFSHVVVSLTETNGSTSLKLGTGPFYLESSYRRAAASALAAASAQQLDGSNPNGNIYAAVSDICRPRAIQNGWSWDSPEHIACWTEELAKYPAEDVLSDTATATLPSTELYRREYSSPLFCFSLTTFLLILSALCFLGLFIRFVKWLFIEITIIITKSA